MIETGIYKLLLADPTVSALVGKRVFYQAMPENTKLPAIVFWIVTSDSEFTLDGPDSLTARRYQFDAYASEAFAARALIEAVRDAIEGIHTLPDGTVVQSAIHQRDADLPLEVGPGGFVFRSYLDIELAFSPTT